MNYSQLVQDVLDGNESALKAFTVLKEAKDHLDKCLEEIKDGAMEEANSFGEKRFSKDGYEFEIRKGGTYYDFKPCKSWAAKNEELKQLEEYLKQAAKSTMIGQTPVDKFGEIIELPTVLERADSLIIKKAKK